MLIADPTISPPPKISKMSTYYIFSQLYADPLTQVMTSVSRQPVVGDGKEYARVVMCDLGKWTQDRIVIRFQTGWWSPK